MDEIEIKFTPKERDLILDHTCADLELTKRLEIAEIKGKHLITKYSIDLLDDLLGYIASEANHTEDQKLEKKLDKLYERLSRIFDKYAYE